MEISDVKEIEETTRKYEVNQLLELGWVLLNTASGQWPDSQEAHIRYTLGWTGELPAKRPG
ncbi:MAG: hypothetical protein HUJ16_05905 [Kangiella sp.]|nr:hypothetical protein [Kangiella sp.]